MSLERVAIAPDLDAASNNLAKADHRIANHLAMLSSYVRIKGRGLTERDKSPTVEDVRCLTRLIVAQIDAISDLHRILSELDNPDTLDLSVPLCGICKAMQAGVAGELDIVMTLDKNCYIALKSILPVTQIFSEIITNAIKHGCNSEGQGTIRVLCYKSTSGTVLVKISDNGPGLADKSNPPGEEGLGLRLINALIRQVGGSVNYSSTSHGLTVRMELPAAAQSTSTLTAARSKQSSLFPNNA